MFNLPEVFVRVGGTVVEETDDSIIIEVDVPISNVHAMSLAYKTGKTIIVNVRPDDPWWVRLFDYIKGLITGKRHG